MKQLHSKDGAAIFTLPAVYEADATGKDKIHFSFRYPGMQAIRPGQSLEKDQIKIYLSPTIAPDRSAAAYAQDLESRALDHYDPAHPRLEYRTGQYGDYRMYQKGAPGKPEHLLTFYVFKAIDGQRVWLLDPAHFIGLYKARRTMGYRFDVEYTIAKGIGRDFIKIDEVVTTLINQNTT